MSWRSLWIMGLLVISWLWQAAAVAGPLGDRLAQFPDWSSQPLVQAAKGDLIYPNWFSGTWEVTTTLVDLVAPLAPDITTPGFDDNQQYLDQSIQFQARFVAADLGPWALLSTLPFPIPRQPPTIVADRAFNSLNLTKAYLKQANPEDDAPVMAVKVDPRNPNRQITFFNSDRRLVSTVAGRATESPTANQFITTEMFRQEFRGASQLYFNQVESTTAYIYHDDEQPTITADQITAIYLSPQDPDFFTASDRPVALYRYRLEFVPATSAGNPSFNSGSGDFISDL